MSAKVGSEDYYPPRLTGMRGSHVGSFEVAHGVAREGKIWPRPATQTDDTYDLVIVGGGISGLSSAFLYQQKTDPKAKVLILENHDDFGGHAKRNEFDVDGHHLIGYGGSETLESPSSYSPVAKKLLRDISIEVQKFYKYFDEGFTKKWNLEDAIYFTKKDFGVDRIIPDPFGASLRTASEKPVEDLVGAFPLRQKTKDALIQMLSSKTDYLSGKSKREKIDILRKMSYVDFLQKFVKIPAEGTDVLQEKFKSYWGIGWDALSALEGFRLEMPGTSGLGITHEEIGNEGQDEPYIFHFPDGNAGVARSLVRKLIPEALPGENMIDLVTTKLDYSLLDTKHSNIRIRLNSTAVDVRHTEDQKFVDVTYVQKGKSHRVRATHVILACNNNIIPHICPEVPDEQREAIEWATRIPLVYVNIALRNWRAFANLGYKAIFIPKAELIYHLKLDYPVSMGDYKFSESPDQPIIVHGICSPTTPGQGYTPKEQFILGQQKLYETSFAAFEDEIIQNMSGALGAGGFDAERDIAAITVNRWPHGYAYEYNELFDPLDWNPENGPHIAGRAQIGRISIANSDASAYAYVDGAIDAAARAVDEQVAVG